MNPIVAAIRPANPEDPPMISMQIDLDNQPTDIVAALADALTHCLPAEVLDLPACSLVERIEDAPR